MRPVTAIRRVIFALFWILAGSLPASAAHGHAIAIPVLALSELGSGQFTVRWVRAPDLRQGNLTPTFPPHCQLNPPLLDCGSRGLVGELGFKNMGERVSAVVVRIKQQDGPVRVFTLTAAQPKINIFTQGADVWLQIARTYLAIGFEHILLGVDHLLFVLGLIWIVRSRWMLIKTITAFTVAHSITLAAVTFGWVGVPERAVNAAIALSIVFIGVEILKVQRGQGGLTARFPWIVAFAFGLLHGFGFADALVKLGLPEANLPLALLSFNVGVELGQIAFVLLVLGLNWSFRTLTVHWPRWSEPIPAYLIGSLAMFWFINRMLPILTT